ncbi:SDR family oxidoreductase [Patulibacter medicamentivorans]|uniref:SDR family oxidoreductase n=1 Tax=Patulibacter medicamentivorans TaxID=1097667 RepID=UPI00058BB7F2|nr:SDR family oxidoreductase [Patulibacter medicamentivorans]
MTLQGKTAIVTAASRGIGRATAERLAADGAAVVVNWHRSGAAAAEVVTAIEARGGQAIAVQGDIGVQADVVELFDVAEQRFGGVDVVVNNASANIDSHGPVAGLTDEQIEHAIALSFRGSLETMRQAATRLRDGGRIVNVSTGYVRRAFPDVGLYAGLKAGIDTLGASLAHELGPRGITVNSVLPGLTDTDGLSDGVRESLDDFLATTPLRRIAQPQEIAAVIAFLVGPDGGWITAESIAATGGLV